MNYVKHKLVLVLLLLFTGTVFTAYSQIPVKIRTGQYHNHQPSKNPQTDPSQFQDVLFEGKHYVLLQFNSLPSEEQKTALSNLGIRFFGYMPENSYYVSIPQNFNYSILTDYNVYSTLKPLANSKIDLPLFNPSDIPWAVGADNRITADVTFMSETDKRDYLLSLYARGAKVDVQDHVLEDVVTVTGTFAQLIEISKHPQTIFIEPVPSPTVLEDQLTISNHRNNPIYTTDNFVTGRKLDGTGVVVSVGDDGQTWPHIDFTGRIEINSTNTAAGNTHGDHTSGIVGGAPNMNPIYRGNAPGVKLRIYDGHGDMSMFPGLYTTNLVRVTSHSLGQTCDAGYDASARTADLQVKSNSSLMHVFSCGNSGGTNCGSGLTAWRQITGGYKAGKNVLAVANLTVADAIATSSSRGPARDGRIKPDISAVGTNVNSTQPNNTYTTMTGTSMACPAIAGTVAVLDQAYKNANGGTEAPAGLIKAILLNTADDLGNAGPDFTYGWGRVNTMRAVYCIEQNRYITGSIANGATNAHNIAIPANVATAKIMVYWTDVEGTSGATTPLVNNINSSVTSPTSTVFQPWLMDPGATHTNASCSAPAIKGVDNKNNMEQVQIDNPAAGTYVLSVNGFSIPTGPQTYFVVYEFYYTNALTITHPFGGETFVPAETQRIRWDATGNSGTFGLEYSTNEGTSWTSITTGIAATQRYYDWTVPNVVTGKARIRLTRSGFTDVSDTNFVIISVPTGINFRNVCAGTTRIRWTAVAGATGYDVYRLGAMYMTLVATTSLDSVVLASQGNTAQWYAVRAKVGTGMSGRRTVAVTYTNTSTGSCILPISELKFKAAKKDKNVVLDWELSTEEGVLKYEVERSASAEFDDAVVVGEVKTTKAKKYRFTDATTYGNGSWYYRLKVVEQYQTNYTETVYINWEKDEFNVSLYPVPAATDINIEREGSADDMKVEVYSTGGVKLNESDWTGEGNVHTLNISQYSPGTYIVKLINRNTGKVTAKHFTVVR